MHLFWLLYWEVLLQYNLSCSKEIWILDFQQSTIFRISKYMMPAKNTIRKKENFFACNTVLLLFLGFYILRVHFCLMYFQLAEHTVYIITNI